MSRVRDQRGFTLTELLVGMTLMLIVMSASLLVLQQVQAISTRTDRRVDLQDDARRATREITRSLRNLAASPDAPAVVERANDYDLVFRMADKPRADAGANTRNLRRVRYCLDASDPDRGRILEQTYRWSSPTPPGIPGGTGCPATGWQGAPRVVATKVTNRATVDRPLWSYGLSESGQISSVKLNLFMNADPALRAREVALQTGVFLRNQNRGPAAGFSAAAVGTGHVLLNGSASSDPEGQPLDYIWYVDGVQAGRGMVFDYYSPTPGLRTFQLEVLDSGGLADRSATQTVDVR